MFQQVSRQFPSNMVHSFSNVPRADVPRSSFNRPHTLKTTFDGGYLVPIYVEEALPGDTFNVNMSALIRLATPIHPCMDNMKADVFFFSVPDRLIWQNHERQQGAQDNPGDSTDFLAPQIVAPAGGWTELSLEDYFGLPTKVAGLSVSSKWHRAYNLIWNTWFRDQNLQDSVVVDKDDGPDTATDYVLLKRGKRHDYFTSCLPWPQKGPDVLIPMGDIAPVSLDTASSGSIHFTSSVPFTLGGGISGDSVSGSYPTQDLKLVDSGSGVAQLYRMNPEDTLVADLSSAVAVTVNQLREAVQLQKLLERDARSGTRYVESLAAHWGVTSPDFRLQNPEYLGGGSITVNITPVPQTSATAGSAAQGNLAGVGTGVSSGRIGFTKSFVEHCVILGFISVRADLTYWQGIPRMFNRRTRYDGYLPALAHLGEQEVLNKEIFAQGPTVLNPVTGIAYDEEVFGYQERWGEYRYGNSRITGLFRGNAATPLDSWHLSQEFGGLPALNSEFIEENPPIDRIIAVPSEPHFIFDSFFDVKTARPMPLYSVPGLMDHF